MDGDALENMMTMNSVKEAEKQYNHSVATDKDTYAMATKENTSMHFDDDDFSKASITFDQSFVQIPRHIPGVTLIQELSDPIHGSIGEPKIKMEDLLPEQQFEESQRRKKPQVFKDDKHEVTWTQDSLKTAEEIVGAKMPSPEDADQKKKYKATPKYHLADSDDEDQDTVETRKSVKTIEKREGVRFHINAADARQYHKDIEDGKISAKQMNFEEDSDEETGAVPADQATKRAAKKRAAVEEKAAKDADAKLSPKEKKAKAKAEAIDDKIAKSKEETPLEKTPPKVDTSAEDSKIVEKEDKEPAAKAAAFAQQRSTDSDSSDSDSDSDSDWFNKARNAKSEQ